jgi:hypothetical protein
MSLLERLGAAGGEIVSLDERDAQSAHGCIESDPGTRDSAADHEHVEGRPSEPG